MVNPVDLLNVCVIVTVPRSVVPVCVALTLQACVTTISLPVKRLIAHAPPVGVTAAPSTVTAGAAVSNNDPP